MKYSIDFSLFASPTRAFGNVTGEMEFPSPPVLGQFVELVDGKRTKITTLVSDFEGWVGTVVGLDDVVLESEEDARVFAKRLESVLDLFVVPYHDE